MDRKTLAEDLERAEQYVSLGESRLRSQQRVIAELERDGHDSKMAHTLYRTFEELQATHIASRDRLAGALSQAESATPSKKPNPS
jgi:hypothetical protein